MKRGLKITALALLALVLLIVLSVTAVLGTAAGSRWVLGLVPGLAPVRAQARKTVVEKFDLRRVCLPRPMTHVRPCHRLLR